MDSLLTRAVMNAAMLQFHTFLLVLIRLSGLTVAGPLWGQTTIPANLRVLLVITMSLLITPNVSRLAQQGFAELDENHDGRWNRGEVPAALEPRFEQLVATHSPRNSESEQAAVTLAEYLAPPALPRTLLDYGWLALSELLIGFLLGTGIQIVLSGLQLAGQLIDQQSGFGLGEVFNPDLNTSGSASGQALFLLGTVVFLTLDPFQGHLRLIGTLVDSFQTLPPGQAVLGLATGEVLQHLVMLSLQLGIKVAAPLMVVMSLLDLTMGFLGHSVPQINLQGVGYALRSIVAFAVLLALWPGVGELFSNCLPEVWTLLRTSLGLSP